MTKTALSYQVVMDKKKEELERLKQNRKEMKDFLEQASEAGATDKEAEIAEIVHWHNLIDDLISEMDQVETEETKLQLYVVEEKYPEDIQVEIFETEALAEAHCKAKIAGITEELINQDYYFEFDRTHNTFRIDCDEKEGEVILSYYQKTATKENSRPAVTGQEQESNKNQA